MRKGPRLNTCRAYSFRDLILLRVAGYLSESGLGTSMVRKVVGHLSSSNKEFSDTYIIVPEHQDVIEVDSEAKIWHAMQPHCKNCFVFALGPIIREVAEAASKVEKSTGRRKRPDH